jgi:cell division protease FtsH
LVFILGYFLLRGFFTNTGVNKVPYSQFLTALKNDQFERVVIGDDWVKGFLAAGADQKPPEGQKGQRELGKSPRSRQLPWLANRVPEDQELFTILQSKGIEYEAKPSSGFSDIFWLWVIPIGIGLILWSIILRRMSGQVGQGPPGIMSFGKSTARIHSESDTGVGFKDVAGIDEAVEEIQEIVEFLKTPEKFRRLGGRVPKGVLLVGPTGTGKTLLARAVAGEAGVPFFSLTGSEFVEMFVGVGAARVRDLFQQAHQKAPCIVFIDELDAIGKTRNANVLGGHDEREQTLNQLLAEMDGFDSKTGLIVVAATNRPEILDPALLRPGRFDRQVLVDRPDRKGRESILFIHVRAIKVGAGVSIPTLASRTPGFAGADLANVCNEAALLAARRGSEAVEMRDFEEAVERVVAGLEKKSRRMNEHEKQIVAFHESGHALVGWMLPFTERIQKVSIIPRGMSALGYTLQLPIEDRYLMSNEELRDKVAALMGGRATEELFVGSISTGAVNDLKLATDIARRMVREYGMSGALGPMSLTDQNQSVFLGPGAAAGQENRNCSEQTAEAVDEEIRAILQEGLELARRIVSENRNRLQKLAARLLVVEVMDGDELMKILGPKVRSPSALMAPHADDGAEVRPVESYSSARSGTEKGVRE